MTSVNTGLNPYARIGSAYTRNTSSPLSLAGVLAAADDSSPFASNAATNLTLSDAARARLADTAASQDFSTVTTPARSALDNLYAAVNVSGPLEYSGNATVDLTSLDRRSLFAIATNNAGMFTTDEQGLA